MNGSHLQFSANTAASAGVRVIFSVTVDSSLARYLCIIVICTFSAAYQGSKILTERNLKNTF